LTDNIVIRNRVSAVLDSGVSYVQERTQRPLDQMVSREVSPVTGKPTALRSLFDYWQSRRVGETAPACAFDPSDAFTPEEFQWVSWVDVRPADPMDFVFQAHPGFLFGNWSEKTVRDYPNEIHAKSLALEYLTCKMVRQPSYYELTQQVGEVSRTYMRLLLPLEDRNRTVPRLYYATRYERIEIDGAPVTRATRVLTDADKLL
jgi:hypothetical protein